MITPVGVRNQSRAVKSSPGPIGAASLKDVFSPGLELNGFFIVYSHAQPPELSVTHTAGFRGKPLLWVRYETEAGVAKIVPLIERLSGMCGSVQHVRFSPFFGRARLCSPSSIEGLEHEQDD